MILQQHIAAWEGFSLKGHVPPPDGGATESGLTLAGGYDVGQRQPSDLPAFIRDKLRAYCGITGFAAVAYVKANPVELTPEEGEKLSAFSHAEATRLLLEDWRKTGAVPFAALADELQTVIASVAYQYGDLPTGCPNYWRQVTSGDWVGALANLRKFGDNFPTRRNKEADLLEARLKQYGLIL